MKIIIDQREKRNHVPQELVLLGNKIEFKHLPIADYIVGEVAIERKTASDFINSMINKRLIRQLEELQQFNKAFLIVEGDLFAQDFENANALRGMLLSIILDYNIPVIYTYDYEDTAKFITTLVKRIKKGRIELGLKFKKRAYSRAEQQQIIIEGLPSVGPHLAKALLKHFKTIQNLANAEEEELCKVEKIGKKKAKIIKGILEERYKP